MVLLEASIRALSWVNGHLLRIGYGIGILPGAGGSMAAFVSFTMSS